MRRLQPFGAYDLSERLGAGAPGDDVERATSWMSVDGDSRRIDADGFALGRYRSETAIAGRLLEGARAADVTGRSAAGDAPDPREITARMSPRVAWILLKALAKPRARRYATADQLHTDVPELARHEGLLVRPTRVARTCAMIFLKSRRTAPQVVRSA